MITLHSNLSLQNLDSEEFYVEKNMIPYDLTTIKIESLPQLDKTTYENFVNLIGISNVIITEIPSSEDVLYCFFRNFRFDHDSSFNIVGLTSYLKPYSDFTTSEKLIIDSFVEFISNFVN